MQYLRSAFLVVIGRLSYFKCLQVGVLWYHSQSNFRYDGILQTSLRNSALTLVYLTLTNRFIRWRNEKSVFFNPSFNSLWVRLLIILKHINNTNFDTIDLVSKPDAVHSIRIITKIITIVLRDRTAADHDSTFQKLPVTAPSIHNYTDISVQPRNWLSYRCCETGKFVDLAPHSIEDRRIVLNW